MVGLLPLSEMLKGLFVLLSTIRLRLVPLLNASRWTCIESACRVGALHPCLQLDSVSYCRDELFQSWGGVSQTTLLPFPRKLVCFLYCCCREFISCTMWLMMNMIYWMGTNKDTCCGLSHTSCQDFVIVREVVILIQKSSAFHHFHFKQFSRHCCISLFGGVGFAVWFLHLCNFTHNDTDNLFFTIPGIFMNLLNISQSFYSLYSMLWMYTWRCYFGGYRCTKREVAEPALFPSSLFTVGLSHSL